MNNGILHKVLGILSIFTTIGLTPFLTLELKVILMVGVGNFISLLLTYENLDKRIRKFEGGK